MEGFSAVTTFLSVAAPTRSKLSILTSLSTQDTGESVMCLFCWQIPDLMSSILPLKLPANSSHLDPGSTEMLLFVLFKSESIVLKRYRGLLRLLSIRSENYFCRDVLIALL